VFVKWNNVKYITKFVEVNRWVLARFLR
jgi:hypothetical protein